MITAAAIAQWRISHNWATAEQVEQDLLLSRAICEIANHDFLGRELVFRGGTALHKLHVAHAYRYSEDLDYVRRSASGVQPLTTALTRLGQDLGFTVTSKIGQQVKIFWRTTAQSGVPIKIKIETNTHERSPHFPHQFIGHEVQNSWWSGNAQVQTFDLAELVATKIRALYQRSKGRDLFDLWLAVFELGVDPERILEAFESYQPANWNPKEVVRNLELKLADAAFCKDLDLLVREYPAGYDVQSAGKFVIEEILQRGQG